MRKILSAILLMLFFLDGLAQENRFVGQIVYVKESLSASGEYQAPKGFSNTTYFNESSYAYLTSNTVDYAKGVEKGMKSMPTEFAKDSFEVARMKTKLVQQMEIQTKGLFDMTTVINYSSNIQIQTRAESGQKYCVKDTLGTLNFELKDDTMNIDGLLCQKASVFFSNKFYTVWFAPSFPFAAGPFNLHGLPGIIVLATSEDGKTRYRMTSINYPLETVFVVTTCDGGKEISGKDYRVLDAKRQKEFKDRMEDLKKKNGK